MDLADLAECYEKHAEALLRFAASQVGPNNAEDVVATAVLGLLHGNTGEIENLKAYLYRAVTNEAAKHWRALDRRHRRERIAAGRSFDGVDFHPELSEMLRPELTRALAQLSPQQRAVLHLTYWEDLTPSSVAARLGVSDGTVRRQLARDRSRIRAALK